MGPQATFRIREAVFPFVRITLSPSPRNMITQDRPLRFPLLWRVLAMVRSSNSMNVLVRMFLRVLNEKWYIRSTHPA